MDTEYKYLRTGPEKSWKMAKELYAKCPECGYYMSLDPTTDDTCPCGNLQKDSGACRFRVRTGDETVEIYEKIVMDGGWAHERTGTQSNQGFASRVTLDLDTYKEFMKGISSMIFLNGAVTLLFLFALIASVCSIVFKGDASTFFELMFILLVGFGILKLGTRGGDIQYKQMFSNNGGQPVRNLLAISDGRIHIENIDNGNTFHYELEKIRKIGETKNLLILMLDYNQGIPVDKRALTGGTADDLKKYLFSACPNLKTRKVYSGKGSRIRRGILAALLAVGLILALAQLLSG